MKTIVSRIIYVSDLGYLITRKSYDIFNEKHTKMIEEETK